MRIAVQQAPMHDSAERDEFLSLLPDVIADLTEEYSSELSPAVTEHFCKAAHYNLKGNQLRGLLLVHAYKLLETPQNLTDKNIKLARMLGWCVEVMEGALLFQDDIIDGSEKRRGNPCWHRVDDLGLKAFNDSLMLTNGLYTLLKKHFFGHKNYIPILELFHEAIRKIAYGQASELQSSIGEKRLFDNFTMDTYIYTALNKSSFYLFVLPITLVMHLADKYDPELYRQMLPLLNDMGMAYQMMDDFHDSFGDARRAGKMGSDIRTGKCTSISVMAHQYASPSQRQLFEKYYGRPDEASQNEIRNLYKQLGLPKIFLEYITKLMDSIYLRVSEVPNERLPQSILFRELRPLLLYESYIHEYVKL